MFRNLIYFVNEKNNAKYLNQIMKNNTIHLKMNITN